MPLPGSNVYREGLTRRRARLWERLENGYARCMVCERRCTLAPGSWGFCRNRRNEGGIVYNEYYGLLSAVESRPIEIKPLFHYWPGSTSLTYSGWGCNYRCPWCQNHHLSQVEPDPENSIYMEPRELVDYAVKMGDEGICASFNEPTIHLEYVLDASREAKKRGLYSTMVTNGYFTLRALEELVEAGVDGFSIDIKGCPDTYQKLLAADPMVVLRNARRLLDLGAHVEMVFLVVTKANDWEECIRWVLEKHLDILGPSVPLHINRYYPANRWHEPPTSIGKLLWAYEEARRMGIEYVYIGNIGDPRYETTYCPKCGKTLIVREGYTVTYYRLDGDRCPRCGYRVTLRGQYVSKPIRWRTLY